MAVEFDLTQANGTVYPDEVALINMLRWAKRRLTTGYGKLQFTVEFVDHCAEFSDIVLKDRVKVDKDGPAVIGTIRQYPGKAS